MKAFLKFLYIYYVALRQLVTKDGNVYVNVTDTNVMCQISAVILYMHEIVKCDNYFKCSQLVNLRSK